MLNRNTADWTGNFCEDNQAAKAMICLEHSSELVRKCQVSTGMANDGMLLFTNVCALRGSLKILAYSVVENRLLVEVAWMRRGKFDCERTDLSFLERPG